MQHTINVTPQLYDVWLLDFEFEDQPGVSKKRPVIIANIVDDSIEVYILSVKVTSHPPRPKYNGEVVLLDWKEAGLKKPSTARCSKTAKVPKSYFKIKLGKLSDRDAKAVEAALIELGLISC